VGVFMPRADASLRDRARELRREPTEAEQRLWAVLRDRQLAGAHFRRQHPIPPYVADFACVAANLVVEVDGGQHADSDADAERDSYLQHRGWRVLRFWNNEVLSNPEGVAHRISEVLTQAPPPQPSPASSEGGGSDGSLSRGAGEGRGGGALPRATAVAADGNPSDTVTLAYDDRHRRRLRLVTDAGSPFLLDLAEARVLRDGDRLVLDDGGLILVRAAPEAVFEIEAGDAVSLARIAWHLGNRHTPTQILPGRLRIRADHVLEHLLTDHLGAVVRPATAPFDPQGGAYGHGHDH
jgi:very-short-patch-repair endonuclease/urease accessory protein UreE